MKAFADYSWQGRKNLQQKTGNAGYQQALIFPTSFAKVIFFRVLNTQDGLVNPFPNDRF